MHSRLFTRVRSHVRPGQIRAAQAASRCHCCGVPVPAGDLACGEHSSDIFTPSEMKAMYAEATQGRD